MKNSIHPDLQSAVERNMGWFYKKCKLSEFNKSLHADLMQAIVTEIYSSNVNFSKKKIRTADGWVKTIATNVVLSHQKSEAEKPEILPYHKLADRRIVENEPEKLFDLQVALNFIKKNFRPIDREIFTLFLMKEPQQSIAEITGMKVESITNRISILKKEINTYLNKGAESVQ